MEALDFETEPLSKVASARLGRAGATRAVCRMPGAIRLYVL
jgi:hypothetical protein